ncbi:MAG: sensor histidine kinase [Pirellulales bacterium]|nr:sensor histidine kinase [Pirellulales bacterium]
MNEIEVLKAQLLEARKQATLGELLGTTTHEFNNALTTILNYARLGLRHPDKETRDKALNRILSASTRAAKITESILSMSRSQRSSNRMEPVNLVSLTEEVLVLLEREMMKYRVQVEREVSEVPKVLANPGQLQQVLLNLLVNARQAMPDGGRLILRIAASPARRSVSLLVLAPACGVSLSVIQKMFDVNIATESVRIET